MSELTLFLLQLLFLALLWFFVFFIVYSLRVDLFGDRVRLLVENRTQEIEEDQEEVLTKVEPVKAPLIEGIGGSADSSQASKLVITSGKTKGKEILLGDEAVTIGRSPDCTLVLKDEFTSTRHARLLPGTDGWILQDLDSTNGTFLDGKKLKAATLVALETPIKIGKTVFELRS